MARKIRGRSVTDSQFALHAILKQYGPLPDHALVPLAQHVTPTHLSSSGIRSRRAELADKGLAVKVGEVKTASNRGAAIWKAK